MPCGQKKSASEMIHSQTVTPPLAAMDGTTLRLKTATTKSRTRSHRPSTRRRCSASCVTGADGAAVTSFANGVFSMNDRTHQTSAQPRPQMPRRAAAVLLQGQARLPRTLQDAYQCPLRCAEQRWSTAHPTNTAEPARRD